MGKVAGLGNLGRTDTTVAEGQSGSNLSLKLWTGGTEGTFDDVSFSTTDRLDETIFKSLLACLVGFDFGVGIEILEPQEENEIHSQVVDLKCQNL